MKLDFVEDRTPNGVLVRVYTPLGKREQGQFALQVAVKTLPFYDQWFGIPYPLPKMDLLAIPDFAAGAMENWYVSESCKKKKKRKRKKKKEKRIAYCV